MPAFSYICRFTVQSQLPLWQRHFLYLCNPLLLDSKSIHKDCVSDVDSVFSGPQYCSCDLLVDAKPTWRYSYACQSGSGKGELLSSVVSNNLYSFQRWFLASWHCQLARNSIRLKMRVESPLVMSRSDFWEHLFWWLSLYADWPTRRCRSAREILLP